MNKLFIIHEGQHFTVESDGEFGIELAVGAPAPCEVPGHGIEAIDWGTKKLKCPCGSQGFPAVYHRVMPGLISPVLHVRNRDGTADAFLCRLMNSELPRGG